MPFDLHGLTAGDVSQGHRFLGGPVTDLLGRELPRRRPRRSGSSPTTRSAAPRSSLALDREAAARRLLLARPAAASSRRCCSSSSGPASSPGRFDERHLRLPPRVLVTAMQGHQRYFPLEDARRRACTRRSSRSRTATPPTRPSITRGNEGVLRRPSAGRQRSASRRTWPGRPRRPRRDARHDRVPPAAGDHRRQARPPGGGRRRHRRGAGRRRRRGRRGGRSACQGRPGRRARGRVLGARGVRRRPITRAWRGRPEAVCLAVEEHYLPEGPDSPTPSTEAGALLALAEKVDNLVGAFAVDEAPDRLQGPVRPAPGRRRSRAHRARARLGPRPRGPRDPVLPDVRGSRRRPRAGRTRDHRAPRRIRGGPPEFPPRERGRGRGGNDRRARRRHRRAGRHGRVGAVRATGTRPRRVLGGVGRPATAASGSRARGPKRTARGARRATPGSRRSPTRSPHRVPASTPPARPATSTPRSTPAPPSRPLSTRFFSDVLVNADDPVDRARRYALVREAADVLGRIADFTGSPTREGHDEHHGWHQAGLRLLRGIAGHARPPRRARAPTSPR